MADTFRINFLEIPEIERELIMLRLASYSVSINVGDMSDGDYVGSAVLARYRNHFGLLTAKHVVDQPRFRSAKIMLLSYFEGEHRFPIDMQWIDVFSPGVKSHPELGPDLAFVRIPDAMTRWIKAKKQFYNLESGKLKIEERIAKNTLGTYFIVGTPQQFAAKSRATEGKRTVNLVSTMNQVMVAEVQRDWILDKIDYYDMILPEIEDPAKAIKTFKGVSGGGLWGTQLRRPEPSKMFFEEPDLVGVAFYADALDGRDRICCQGWRSLFGDFLESLVIWLDALPASKSG